MVQEEQKVRPPRPRSILSFTSHKSSGSNHKEALVESPKDKLMRRITSKADPTMAISEKEPAVLAQEETTLESIRSIQHRDMNGNIITDPDRSNPTRPRMERPLDTIRSFEAAIDMSYNRRPHMPPPPSRAGSSHLGPSREFAEGPENIQSRRSSYHPAFANSLNGYSPSQMRFPADYNNGYHGGRPHHGRPESYVDGYYNQNRQSPAPFIRRGFGPRNHSDPVLYGSSSRSYGGGQPHPPPPPPPPPHQHAVYPNHHQHQQSYETARSASNSGTSHGTEPWANSTDPSSENSSIERVPNPPPKPDLGEAYGFSGFGGAPQLQGPILEERRREAPQYGQPGYGQDVEGGRYAYQGNDVPPPPPVHALGPKQVNNGRPLTRGSLLRKQNTDPGSIKSSTPSTKRRSWLKRTFSKSG